MFASALRGPFPPRTASAASQPGRTARVFRQPFPGSTSSTSTAPQGPQAEACTRDDAEEADHLYDGIPVTGDPGRWGEVERCILTLLWANKAASANQSVWASPVPYPDANLLARNWMAADDWQRNVEAALRRGFFMDREAVKRAVAQWDSSKATGWDSKRATAYAEHLKRVVRAAAREGEGVIVHPGRLVSPSP
jgi:hypothetical protein